MNFSQRMRGIVKTIALVLSLAVPVMLTMSAADAPQDEQNACNQAVLLPPRDRGPQPCVVMRASLLGTSAHVRGASPCRGKREQP